MIIIAVSHYTLSMLQEMATKLGLSGKTKSELYDKIKTVFDM